MNVKLNQLLLTQLVFKCKYSVVEQEKIEGTNELAKNLRHQNEDKTCITVCQRRENW